MASAAFRLALIAAGAASLAACATPRYATTLGGPAEGSHTKPYIDPSLRGTMKPYEVHGVWYTPKDQPHYNETGVASWYGYESPNRTTANGEPFNTYAVTAAHKTLPLPSLVEVTNLDNGKKVVVRVNDRGPFVGDRIIDLSRAAAQLLGFADKGTARVRVRYLGPAGDPVVRPLDRQVAALSPPRDDPRAPATADPRALGPVGSHPPAALMAQPPIWRVQAAAFSSRANADHAASLFATAHVEPLDRGGVTLWRVILGPANDARAADLLRDQAAAAGFQDATVLGPL